MMQDGGRLIVRHRMNQRIFWCNMFGVFPDGVPGGGVLAFQPSLLKMVFES